MPTCGNQLRRSALASALALMALLRGKHAGTGQGDADPTADG